MSNHWGSPFYYIFGNSVAKVLDQASIVGNMEQTISMLVESTELDYKTVKSAVNHLITIGVMKETRKIGNAQAYTFNIKTLSGLLKEARL